ncbi:MAG: serine hydrolase, partial [Clostridia bacterium]|nr:serine hydrolase [Clostridia bacterium]
MSRNVCAVMLAFVLMFALLADAAVAAPLEEGVPLDLTAASAMLLEAETGTIIFEKNADEQRPVASVTKLMTLLLCLEELEAGRLKWEDQITVS